MTKKKNIAILIFNDVEVLDFTGPYEVFSRTRLIEGVQSRLSDDSAPFNVFTVSEKEKEIVATGGLRFIADYLFINSPKIDILLIPGGLGTRSILKKAEVLKWIKLISGKCELVCSVCTGSLILAKIGLLDNKSATTHWGSLSLLSEISNSINVVKNKKVVFDGIYTSAGVSSGIDMSIEIVKKMYGTKAALDIAKYIEWKI